MLRGAFLVLLFAICLQSANGEPWLRPNADCAGCQAVVSAAMKVASNATLAKEVLDAMIKNCHSMGLDPSLEKLCDSMSKFVVDNLPWVKKELEGLAWDIPIAFCAVFLHECTIDCCDTRTPFKPEQVHLALTNDASEMHVSWVTFTPTSSFVQYGTDQLTMMAPATTRTYKKGGWLGTIYSATMTGLKVDTKYNYRVGSDKGWGQQWSFRTLPKIDPRAPAERPLTIAVVGDMAFDNVSDATVMHLTQQAQSGKIDMVIHAGDISYADGYQLHWDMFMRKIEPIAARVPYMTAPGNHEFWFNFTAYENRWFMPNATSRSPSNLYYTSIRDQSTSWASTPKRGSTRRTSTSSSRTGSLRTLLPPTRLARSVLGWSCSVTARSTARTRTSRTVKISLRIFATVWRTSSLRPRSTW